MTRPATWDGASFRDQHLTSVEAEALGVAGYGGRTGPTARPAVLVVDVTKGFCGPRGADLLTAVGRYPHACGPAAWHAVGNVRTLVGAARSAEVPIVFTKPSPPHAAAASRWDDKNRRQRMAPDDAFALVPEAGVAEGDVILEKEAPSAFFGSPLGRWLTGWSCDSVVVCGGTTSGCVRATVVDAFSRNLKVTVAGDACFDRVRVSHDVGLFDMDLKYADVLTVGEIADLLPSPSRGGAVM